MLNFLHKQGDRLVKAKPSPQKRFSIALELVQHVLKRSTTGSR